jgi:3-deoxy-D-manno-octulosonic acid kinase
MTSATADPHVVRESKCPLRDGAMLFDPTLMSPDEARLFDPDAWRVAGSVEAASGGRGTIVFLSDGGRRWVLRRYRRGGAVARLLGDRYLWTGESRTRGFHEWRLLRQLADWQLPVPDPIAASYRRAGWFYRAELLTAELPTRITLAQALVREALSAQRWQSIGQCIKRFHQRGVQHADLNAHNVLLGETGEVYLLDFDRGRLRARGLWEEVVLARLERSLRKVTRVLPVGRYGPTQWQELLAGYGDR